MQSVEFSVFRNFCKLGQHIFLSISLISGWATQWLLLANHLNRSDIEKAISGKMGGIYATYVANIDKGQ